MRCRNLSRHSGGTSVTSAESAATSTNTGGREGERNSKDRKYLPASIGESNRVHKETGANLITSSALAMVFSAVPYFQPFGNRIAATTGTSRTLVPCG